MDERTRQLLWRVAAQEKAAAEAIAQLRRLVRTLGDIRRDALAILTETGEGLDAPEEESHGEVES